MANQERALNDKRAELAKPIQFRKAIKPIQIPLWDNNTLAVQFDLARSALFTTKSHGKRKYFSDEIIPSLSHLNIVYRGEELRQREFDVYLEILSLARGHHITTENPWTKFNGRALLKELGWTLNKNSIDELKAVLSRLISCNVQVVRKEGGIDRAYGYSGFLERMAYVVDGEITANPEGATEFAVIINTEIAEQIRPGLYTKVDKTIRKQLNALGKWLQAFYATHNNPFPISIAKIQEYSGSMHYTKSQFRYILKAQLKIMKDLNVFSECSINKDDHLVIKKGYLYGQISTLEANDER